MSTVYAGEHVTLRRPVAIKVLHAHLVGEGVSGRRMVEEAHTVAALHHPGIVEVLDVGTTEDGRTFVVMERLNGEVLSARLQRGRLAEERAIVFGRQLASALEAAHAAGVVHRDLKPENVFIVQDPDVAGGERIKVLDFGIAKRAVDGREKTLTGIVLGTPAYMAPEQTNGSEVDARADVYALGIVLYLMVTGALPFQGANTDELFVEHAFCAPAPPADKAPVSRRLSAIIERCLAKRPGDRYDSMAVLAATLDGLEGGSGRAGSGFEDEDTNVETDEDPTPPSSEVSGEISIAATPAFTTSESTGRMARPPLATHFVERARPPIWLWPIAVCGAVALGLTIAVAVRATRAPVTRHAPEVSATESRSASSPSMRTPGPAAAAAIAPPAARPRSERRAEKKLEKPERARTSTREPARRTPPPPPLTKEEAFARVEPPTLY